MLIPYIGGKSKLFEKLSPYLERKYSHIQPFIQEWLETVHPIEYREPFAGGLGLFPGLCRRSYFESVRRIWINDLDPAIACVWTCVIRFPEDLCQRLLDLPEPSRQLFNEFKEDVRAMEGMPTSKRDMLEYAVRTIFLHRISHVGDRAGGYGYIKAGRWKPAKIAHLVWEWHRRFIRYAIKGSCCTCQDFAEVVETATKRTVIYLDPPYYDLTHYYARNFNEEDHVRLMRAVKNTRAKWVLTYGDHKRIRELYDWATIKEVPFIYTAGNRVKQGIELIIVG